VPDLVEAFELVIELYDCVGADAKKVRIYELPLPVLPLLVDPLAVIVIVFVGAVTEVVGHYEQAQLLHYVIVGLLVAALDVEVVVVVEDGYNELDRA
jgi:hypothetical protein